jgi:hypothetical protein
MGRVKSGKRGWGKWRETRGSVNGMKMGLGLRAGEWG